MLTLLSRLLPIFCQLLLRIEDTSLFIFRAVSIVEHCFNIYIVFFFEFIVWQEKKIIQDQFNNLQKQLTATEQKAKVNEGNAKLELESLRNALREVKSSHKEATSLLQVNLLYDKCIIK